VIKVVVVNSKGGSGKSTLAINLASWCALQGYRTTLMDFDPQGSASRWLNKRAGDRPLIHGVAAWERRDGVTRSWQLRLLPGTERVIVDTPAGVDLPLLAELTRDAHGIVVPVLPSDLDIHAASRCIGDLLVAARVHARAERIGVVANRVRRNTRVFQSLMRFLRSLEIPVVGVLRDAQGYNHAAAAGLGIGEIGGARTRPDTEQWQPLLQWVHSRGERQRPQLRTVS